MSWIVLVISVISLIASGAFGVVANVIRIQEDDFIHSLAFFALMLLLATTGIVGILSQIPHA